MWGDWRLSLLQKHATQPGLRARERQPHVSALHKSAEIRASGPGVDECRDLRERVHDGVRSPLAVPDLGRRDPAVRDVDGPEAGVLGTPDVVEEAVADVDAPARL